MPSSARFSAGGANSPRYATTYATPEVLDAPWRAIPQGSSTGGAIQLYPRAAPRAGGGFAIPAPPVSSPRIDAAWEATTWIDPSSGATQWRPTAGDAAWHRRHNFPVPAGYEDLITAEDALRARPPRPTGASNAAASVGRAAGGQDVIRGLGGAGGLAAGGVLAGGFAGIAEYQSGGGVASAVAVGVGAGAGSVVGSIIGGVAGSAFGPVGTVVGGMIGGALGSALGGALGRALVPDANLNGALLVEGQQASAQLLQSTGFADFSSVGGARIRYLTNPSYPDSFSEANILAYELWDSRKMPPYYNNSTPRMQRIACSGGSAGIGEVVMSSISILQTGNCVGETKPFQPAVEPVPYDPNTRSRPSYRPDPILLPGPQGEPGPRGRPGPTGRPFPIPFPIPIPRPIGEPDPIPKPDPTDDPYPWPWPWPRPTPTPGPTKDPAPYPDPDPNPGPDPNPNPDDPDVCDPCAKLDEILELLQPEIAGQIDLSPCPVGDSQVEDIRTIEGAGLVGISEKLGLSLQSLDALWELLRCEKDTILTVPEHWPLRRGAERPQLIVVYSTQNQDGSWGNSRYQFSIPWFDHRFRKTLKSMLPKQIRKGPKQGTILLTDNSKMTLFCSTHQEAERVLKAFENLVVRRYRTGDVRFSDLNGNGKREYNKVTVFPFVAKYYPAGMRNLTPAWTDKLY